MTEYSLLYIYDITPKEKKETNKIKRRFYYQMSKYTPFIRKATKSAFLAKKEYEKILDGFFQKFYGDIEVWKCNIISVELMGKRETIEKLKQY
ncbi:MAG: hypothetical protein ACP5KJ_02455 [Candidatus Micrarchaeia archaeon]